MLTQDLCCIFVHDSGIFRLRVVYVAYLISLVFDACDLRAISLEVQTVWRNMLSLSVKANVCRLHFKRMASFLNLHLAEGSALSRSWHAYAIYFRKNYSDVNTALCSLLQISVKAADLQALLSHLSV